MAAFSPQSTGTKSSGLVGAGLVETETFGVFSPPLLPRNPRLVQTRLAELLMPELSTVQLIVD